MDLRRAVRRVHRLEAAAITVASCDGSRSGRGRHRREVVRGMELEPSRRVDSTGLEVGVTVATAAPCRRRPSRRTSPILDALRLRFVG